MEIPEPTHKLSVKTNLTALLGTLQRSLQRARDMTVFGLVAADNAREQELQLPGAFFQVIPASSVSLDFETAKKEFKRWVLTGAIRDSVEAVHAFLDEARRICFVYSVADKPMIMGGDWNKGAIEDTKKFPEGLPQKTEYLGKKYDRSLVPGVKEEVLSINRARNCLVHRKGTVSGRDLKPGEEGLLVQWRKPEIVASRSDGERIITAPARVEAGETWFLRLVKAQKLFKKGDTVTFTVDEFGELCFTLLLFGSQLVENMERYGRSKGVPFNTSEKNVTWRWQFNVIRDV